MNNIESFSIADLPYCLDEISCGTSASRMSRMRQDVLALLRSRTNIIRVAADYYDSYESTSNPTVMHYRDYLIAEAALATLRSTLYVDPEHSLPNLRAERILEDFDHAQLWPPIIRQGLEDTPHYGSSLGSPGYYFYATDINDVPLESFDKLTRAIWSLNGINPDSHPSERLKTLYQYLGNLDEIVSPISNKVEDLFLNTTPEDEENYRLLLEARRQFIDLEDYENLQESIVMGTWDEAPIDLSAFLLEDEEFNRFSTVLRWSSSIAKPGGLLLLLQNLVVEGFVKAAKALDQLPETVSFSSLREFLLSEDPSLTEVKLQVASSLELVAESYSLMEASGLIQDAGELKAKAFNNALYWLQASGEERLDEEHSLSIKPFVDDYLPNYAYSLPSFTRDSSVYAWGPFYSNLQGLPPRDSQTLLSFDSTYGYELQRQDDTDLRLATIANPDEEPSNMQAYVLHSGREDLITQEQYQELPSASNVVVAQQGDPVSNLSPRVNNYMTMQNAAYETVNTVHLTPSPRGLIGYEELIRGMVSHLFRDPVSEEAVDRAKVDGMREEHTSRVGGLLLQLKDTHLDSEVQVLKEWSDYVDIII
jgi:hypothetical protein